MPSARCGDCSLEIARLEGTGYLLASDARRPGRDLCRLQPGRDEEHTEILGRCADFATESANELAAFRLPGAELEENDEHRAKLKSWLAKVQARDVLGAGEGAEAAVRGEPALGALSAVVHQAEGSTQPRPSPRSSASADLARRAAGSSPRRDISCGRSLRCSTRSTSTMPSSSSIQPTTRDAPTRAANQPLRSAAPPLEGRMHGVTRAWLEMRDIRSPLALPRRSPARCEATPW